jgi:prepilin-type N-terminal cleavage/methylation domain-containing protein
MNTRRRARKGLTLIELVIALTIAAIAISVGYATLGILVDGRDAAESATRETTRAWAVRSTLTDWLAGARLDAQGGAASAFRGLDGARSGLPDDELTFLTAASTPVGDGETLVRLFIARDRTGRNLGLTADLTEWRGTHHESVTLDSAVAGLDISFRSSVFTAPQWITSWVSATVLPSGVQVTLLSAPKDSLRALLRTPLIVALEGGR